MTDEGGKDINYIHKCLELEALGYPYAFHFKWNLVTSVIDA